DDLDNDGDIDAVILNCDSVNQVLENRQTSLNDWIGIRLVGTTSNRSAVGAKVVVKWKGKEKTLWKLNGRGYQSFYGERLHIGLGVPISQADASPHIDKIDEIIVYWPGSKEPTIVKDLLVNQYHDIIEPK
ncbi:MAG: ASPIC/UnbV domain-containing protein, partial [Pirellula sp.]|nr:ASPIC/UnbV domain-containing protein [Pirellula sp.]